jgi:hypothetical protein
MLSMEELKLECETFFKSHPELEELAFDIELAKGELDLDEATIKPLLEDFVIQILIFIEKYHQNNIENLHDAIHKNLGVARNLRVLDAKYILEKIYKDEQTQDLEILLYALKQSAIRLNPQIAFDTLELIKGSKNFI